MSNKLTIAASKAIVASTCLLAFACSDDSPGVSNINNDSDMGWDVSASQDGGGDATVTPDTGESDAGADAQDDASGDANTDPCANVDCSALDDACHQGVCNATTGQCDAQPVADGTTCDDGDLCSTTDVCTAGVCAGAAVDCTSSSDQCNTGVCNPATGACEAQPVTDGTDCNDADLCSTGDACLGGSCVGLAVDCSGSADACHDAACNPADGLCVTNVKADGSVCDDSDACTVSDVCTNGTCGGTTLDCSGVTDQCNAGLCSVGACVQNPVTDGTLCDAQNLCSWADSCQAGACSIGTIVDCSVYDFVVTKDVNTPNSAAWRWCIR
ncbi:MAG: hypothetical protein R3E66_05475 [bacterium]